MLAIGIALPLLVGAISLRVKGIAFAMVTLAFAQAVAITALRNPGGLTGGEEGLSLNRASLPSFLSGVVNAPYRYWLALAFCVFCVLVVAWLAAARTGHAWAAVRENEDRVEVLGLSAYRAKLMAVVVGGFLGTLGGFVQLIIVGGANPHLLSTELTLSLLVMVVLGGAGSRWGPVIGGALYVLLDNRLQELSTSETIAGSARGAAGAAEPAGVRAGPAVRAGGVLRAGRDRRDRRSGAGGRARRTAPLPDAGSVSTVAAAGDRRSRSRSCRASWICSARPGSDQSGPEQRADPGQPLAHGVRVQVQHARRCGPGARPGRTRRPASRPGPTRGPRRTPAPDRACR